MGKSSPEKREASPICGRALLRECPLHYLLTAVFGILGGLLVAFFSEFPSDGLWAAAYWSTSVYGFWIFTTSLLVLWSNKRYVACIGSGLYIFFMFLVTTVYMSLRLFYRGGTPYETLFDMTLHSISGWLWYSTPPALLCAGLAAVLCRLCADRRRRDCRCADYEKEKEPWERAVLKKERQARFVAELCFVSVRCTIC